MKKVFTIFLFLISVSFISFANSPAFENQAENEFKQLNQLEEIVKAHPGISLEEAKQEHSKVFENMIVEDGTAVTAFTKSNGDLPLGIPPFLWGCVFGIIGILLVYIMTDNDKALTKKAVIGCLVGWGLGLVLYFVLVAGVFGAAATTI